MSYHPSLDEVKKLAHEGNLVPVYREMGIGSETPVSAYLKIARGSGSFLLESVEGGERLARYSFIGTEPYLIIKTGVPNKSPYVDPLTLIEEELKKHKLVRVPGLPPFHGGAVGYMSYETVGYFEKLPSSAADPLGLPEAVFLFTDTLLIFDHLQHKIKIVSHAHLDDGVEKGYRQAVDRIDGMAQRLAQPMPPSPELLGQDGKAPVTSNLTLAQFEAGVLRAKEYIYAGDIIQVVLSQRLARPTQAHPFTIYRTLRTMNPSPYMYYLHLDECYIVGTSPELLVRVEDGVVATHPIAGTRPRGRDQAEDMAMEEELRRDEKECAEHIMLVDLGRNDIGRVSQPGTVQVTQLMDVERYSHVMHLVSHVEGRLRPEVAPIEALRACFPAGTVSGAPKIRAMEIIAELETDKRGPYAGAVGYFSFSGNLDTAITIRT
ncbi:MAG: chorismate-binding protein, partial [Chloroflexi bacterium]|nr:chorismate-binding protein [Chloroflexota bacterium]